MSLPAGGGFRLTMLPGRLRQAQTDRQTETCRQAEADVNRYRQRQRQAHQGHAQTEADRQLTFSVAINVIGPLLQPIFPILCFPSHASLPPNRVWHCPTSLPPASSPLHSPTTHLVLFCLCAPLPCSFSLLVLSARRDQPSASSSLVLSF